MALEPPDIFATRGSLAYHTTEKSPQTPIPSTHLQDAPLTEMIIAMPRETRLLITDFDRRVFVIDTYDIEASIEPPHARPLAWQEFRNMDAALFAVYIGTTSLSLLPHLTPMTAKLKPASVRVWRAVVDAKATSENRQQEEEHQRFPRNELPKMYDMNTRISK